MPAWPEWPEWPSAAWAAVSATVAGAAGAAAGVVAPEPHAVARLSTAAPTAATIRRAAVVREFRSCTRREGSQPRDLRVALLRAPWGRRPVTRDRRSRTRPFDDAAAPNAEKISQVGEAVPVVALSRQPGSRPAGV